MVGKLSALARHFLQSHRGRVRGESIVARGQEAGVKDLPPLGEAPKEAPVLTPVPAAVLAEPPKVPSPKNALAGAPPRPAAATATPPRQGKRGR